MPQLLRGLLLMRPNSRFRRTPSLSFAFSPDALPSALHRWPSPGSPRASESAFVINDYASKKKHIQAYSKLFTSNKKAKIVFITEYLKIVIEYLNTSQGNFTANPPPTPFKRIWYEVSDFTLQCSFLQLLTDPSQRI
jgi:hypothetical protein